MKGFVWFAAVLFSFFGVVVSTSADVATPLYVGVIENFNTWEDIPITSQEHVRIAFVKSGADWIPMRTDFENGMTLSNAAQFYPAMVDWTVVFDGKSLGTISSKNPGGLGAYADVATQHITTNPKDIPQVTIGASDFHELEGVAKTRPLVLVSIPNFKDPDSWKPTSLSPTEKSKAIADYRNRHPKMEVCGKTDEAQQHPHWVPYSDNEIIFIKAYRSNNGEVIYGQQLDSKRSECELYDDDNYFDYWFTMSKNGIIRLLGDQMMPLEAVDLDNSGKSDWIFLTSRPEDEDGYKLFYNDFSKTTYFHWFYH